MDFALVNIALDSWRSILTGFAKAFFKVFVFQQNIFITQKFLAIYQTHAIFRILKGYQFLISLYDIRVQVMGIYHMIFKEIFVILITEFS